MRKKILILFSGGTIVMLENEEGILAPPEKKRALQSLLNLEPRLYELADFDLAFIANIDSSEMTPDLWGQMALAIYEGYDKYDGFVITHGTDTLAYTASALTFALQNLGKPVVLTGAQIPGHHLESDARRNLVNAVRIALMDVSGVFVAFGDQIILGARASKISHAKLDAFSSVNVPSLGEIRAHIFWRGRVSKRSIRSLQLELGFDPSIAVLSLVPGMPLHLLEKVVEGSFNGIVLIAYGTGNIPHYYLPFLKKAQEKQIPVIIRTQCLEGSTQMQTYQTGKQALLYHVIEAYDMSLECTITKLMWTIKRNVSYEEIKELMHKNFVGEINKPYT